MKRFCIIGAGNFGFHVASNLYQEGHEVMVVDNNRAHIQQAQEHCSFAILADAADREFLEAQGLAGMDAVVVAIGERSHAATLTTLYLKELGVKKILVKAINEDHGRILHKVGATDIINPEKDMAVKVARTLASPNILDMLSMTGGYSLNELEPPRAFIGKNLIDLNLRKRFGVFVLGIKDVLTDEFLLLPPADRVIRDSDMLLIFGRNEDINRAIGNR
ncbi:potassium channel family protein [Geopsychrobacter electrodiphilus]|uniref:potassium channel family protein n=1 Tax=Geopsychrobacter electrodiphilus TaxID=225196 RepID=UPI0003611CB9|nr:TrkA family potassium uptake protein [Geopsychrobacter electrodiphilus]